MAINQKIVIQQRREQGKDDRKPKQIDEDRQENNPQ